MEYLHTAKVEAECLNSFSFLSFKLLSHTICHNLSGESHISKLASEARCRLGILRHANSFLGTPELPTIYKAFICSLMEYCSPLLGGAPASHLARLHAVETKAFRIIGISRDEAESLGLSLSQQREVSGLSVFYHLLNGGDVGGDCRVDCGRRLPGELWAGLMRKSDVFLC